MAGIYKADAGQMLVAGRMSTFIELGVGFNPDLAARDNAILNAIMLGLTRREARERYDRIIDFAGLREFEDLKLKNYSSGMLVRLAFSVMIQVDADVLLIDEVLAVGDAAFQQKCFDEFNRLRDEGRTILLVTHDMARSQRFCDRAMLLEQGGVVDDRRPRRGRARVPRDELRARRERRRGRTTKPAPGRRHASRSPTPGSRTARATASTLLAQGRRAAFVAVVRFVEAHDGPASSRSRSAPTTATSCSRPRRCGRSEHTGAFAAGERVGFRVAFDNYFAPGRYYATPWVARRGAGQDVHRTARGHGLGRGDRRARQRRPRRHPAHSCGSSAAEVHAS